MYKILLSKIFNVKYVVQILKKKDFVSVAYFASKDRALDYARLLGINDVSRVKEVVSDAVLSS